MKENRACLISGRGAWSAFGGGTLAKINENYNTVIGVSTGSLLAPLTALKQWEILKSAYTGMNADMIFDKCWYKGRPISKKGKIRKFPIIVTLLLGHKSISTSNVLKKTIGEFFTESIFNELRNKNKEILVGTQNLAQVPSKTHYFSSLDMNYVDFKDWMWCSANFLFFTSLVKKSWKDNQGNFHIGQWGNGGVGDLVDVNELIGKGYTDVDIILHRTKTAEKFEGKRIHTLMDNVTTSISAMRYDVEFDYFYDRIKKLNRQGVNVTVYWLPRKLSKNSMVFNKQEMLDWWDEGYETAFNLERIEVFPPLKRKF